MTATWQALIPETPSTEPIAGILEAETASSTAVTPEARNPPSSIPPKGGENEYVSRRIPLQSHTYMPNSRNHHLSNNTRSQPFPVANVSRAGTGSPKRTGEFEGEFTSVPCGEQIWRFYSGKLHRRKLLENRRRVLLKNGLRNLCQINVEDKTKRYWSDVFTTLVDAQWRWTLFVFSVSYVVSWLVFAIIWWIIIVAHNDINNFGKPDWTPCVEGVRSFASVFLFSLETQHTIGYGYHRMTPECPDAILVLCIQSITGVLIEAFMVGVVFAKLSRPKKRSQTLIFSRNAVISQRDGQFYLMFRVGDIRKSHILEAHVRAQVITKRVTAEGEVLPIHQEEIKVGGYGEDEDRILLFWPTTIVHPIDSESPLYEMSASDLLNSKIEIMVVMEGVVESTGMTTQARTSYLASEILWGHRFHDTTSFKSDLGHHIVNFDLFHSTFPVETPLCSAQDLDHIRKLKSEGLSGREILSSLLRGERADTDSTATVPANSNSMALPIITALEQGNQNLLANQKNANNFHDICDASGKTVQKIPTANYNCNSPGRANVTNKYIPGTPRKKISSPALKIKPERTYEGNLSDSDNEEDDEENYKENYTNINTKKHVARQRRDAMMRAHSNSSSSITSESNV